MEQHTKSQEALVEKHAQEMRERLANMAAQKDELAQAERVHALSELRHSMTDTAVQAGAEMEATIREELNAEMEAVKASCAAAIDRLQVRVEAIEG